MTEKHNLSINIFEHENKPVLDKLSEVADHIAAMRVEIAAELQRLHQKVEANMAVSQEVRTVLEGLNTATNEVAARLEALQQKVTERLGGLTDEEQAEFDALRARLVGLAANPNQPVPVEPTA